MTSQDRDERFASWTMQHLGIVFKVARSFTTNEADLDDLTQEILLQLWRSAASFRDEAKPSTWIYRVALNRAITWQRRDTADKSQREPLHDISHLISPSRADQSHKLEAIYEAIRSLKEVDRSLLLLSLDGLSYAAISEILGISESNVGVRLTRSRKQLSNLLKESS